MQSCTYTTYLSGHPYRCARYLFCDFKGQLKLLSLARSALSLADLSTQSHKEANRKISRAHRLVGDMKVTLKLMSTPQSFPLLRLKYLHTYKNYQKLFTQVRKREKIQTQFLLKIWVNSCSTLKATLSLSGDIFFKPLRLVDRYCDIGGAVRQVTETWKYISIIKNGVKTGELTGRLILGQKPSLKKAISLIFALGSMLQQILKLCKVPIHPLIKMIIILSQAIFDLYKIHLKTA